MTSGHAMPVLMYHLLHEGVNNHELDSDYQDKLQPRQQTHYLIKRLVSLGYQVTLTPVDQVA